MNNKGEATGHCSLDALRDLYVSMRSQVWEGTDRGAGSAAEGVLIEEFQSIDRDIDLSKLVGQSHKIRVQIGEERIARVFEWNDLEVVPQIGAALGRVTLRPAAAALVVGAVAGISPATRAAPAAVGVEPAVLPFDVDAANRALATFYLGNGRTKEAEAHLRLCRRQVEDRVVGQLRARAVEGIDAHRSAC